MTIIRVGRITAIKVGICLIACFRAAVPSIPIASYRVVHFNTCITLPVPDPCTIRHCAQVWIDVFIQIGVDAEVSERPVAEGIGTAAIMRIEIACLLATVPSIEGALGRIVGRVGIACSVAMVCGLGHATIRQPLRRQHIFRTR